MPFRLALPAVAANLDAGEIHAEASLPLDLPLDAVEQRAGEFGDSPAAQAGEVHMLAEWALLVVVRIAFQVQKVQFVDQVMALEQLQRAVNGDAVDARFLLPGR